MEITDLVSERVQKFIRDNEQADISKLLLSGKSVEDVPLSLIVDQIKSRKKAKSKLPSWYEKECVIFPPPLSLEQSSSEITARYKANIVSGNRLIDLTGGMGIDSSFFARVFKEVHYVERQEFLVDAFRHNCERLSIGNISFLHDDGVFALKRQSDDYFDVIYLDPARRDQDDQKVFAIASCEPDVVQLQTLLKQKSKNILIKLSPMLDITHTLNHLSDVKDVYVIAVDNECKELLFLMERGFSNRPVIHAVNIEKKGIQKFEFKIADEQAAPVKTGPVRKYLYEPNAAVLKAGAFKLLCHAFGIDKLDEHTHLYSCDVLVPDFPGKSYHVEKSFPPQKKMVKQRLKDRKVSVKTRNFPESVSTIRKKYNLKDGNEAYVFFCQVLGEKTVVECQKTTGVTD